MTHSGESGVIIDLRIDEAQLRRSATPGLADVGIAGHWIYGLSIRQLWTLGECIRLAVIDHMPLADNR